MKGIDISNNDGNVDFQAVKDSGVGIVYLKATEGLTYDDPMMKEFYEQAKAVGLKIGFYHFLRKNDPTQEAIHFLNCISGLAYDCIHMIDVEHDSLKDGSASWRTKGFADYCQSQGVQVGLYTYTSFLKESMDNDSQELPLWIAEYGASIPNISQSYVGFQYSETGEVPGINTNCDLDEFNEGILISGGKKKVKNIVICGVGADERAAKYLADYLKCPVVTRDNLTQDVIEATENVFVVGGIWKPTDKAVLLSGQDRFDTMQVVLKYISK